MSTTINEIPLRVGGAAGRTLLVGPQESPAGYATITAALTDAAEGDTIFIQPGTYDENIVVTKDYITMIAAQLGGYGRPDIAPTAGIALTVQTAQGFVAKGMRFVATTAEAVRHGGNGARFEDCVFDGNGAGTTGTRLKGDDTDDSFTASESIYKDCLFRGAATAVVFDTAEAAVGVGSTHNVFENCRFIDNTQDMVTADSGPGTYSVQDLLVKDCDFLDKNKTNYVDFTTANGGAASDQTGMFSRCNFCTDDLTTTNVAIVGTGFLLIGCADGGGIEDSTGLD